MSIPLAHEYEQNPFSIARLYREAGWMGTIPIPYGKKFPPPLGYTGYKAPYPSDEKLTAWDKQNRASIALRLAQVDYVPPNSPYHASLYELMGIDVDDYGEKNGYKQQLTLEKKHGPLPPTVRSSSRWDVNENSCIHIYLVPSGLRFLGKAAKCIDIIQRSHRYMMAWPSLNPDADAEDSRYRFRARNGAYYDGSPEAPANAIPVAIPPLADVEILPPAWLDYLTCNRMQATDDVVSDLSGNELLQWAGQSFNDSQGEMCRVMTSAVERKIREVHDSADSHPVMLSTHWWLINLAAEGHSGIFTALTEFNRVWGDHAVLNSGRDREVVGGEIRRSVIGTIGKIQPRTEDYIPDDECGSGNVTTLHNVDAWQPEINGSTEEIEIDSDVDGLGPIVNKMARTTEHSPKEYKLTDRGNAQHFIDLYGSDLRYADGRDSWVLWDGERWYRDLNERLATGAFSVVEKRQEQYANGLPRSDAATIKFSNLWKRWAQRSGMDQPIRSALRIAKSLYYQDVDPVAISGSKFDTNPNLLGCENGILELSHNPILRPARKEDFVTYNTNVPYISWDTQAALEADVLEGHQLWKEYLDTFLPDIGLRTFIQKALGHLLVGENPEKLLVFVYGPRDTGKSTMLSGIKSALGDYYGTININLFRNKDLNPNLIRAVPLRVTGMSEIESGRIDANMVKRLTGNDMVTAEAKFSNEIFEGRPQFTTVIACNQEPTITNADEALQERILVLPFEHQIASEKRRYDRQVDIERHSGTAVLSWLIEGWKLYMREGLDRKDWPVEVKVMCGSVTGYLNAAQSFISDCIDRNSQDYLEAKQNAFERARSNRRSVPNVADWDLEWTPPTGVVYELYQRWCAVNGEVPISQRDLTRELSMGAPQSRTINRETRKHYVGFRLKLGDNGE
jgi:P4 family phage/plasmid primase-like protien